MGPVLKLLEQQEIEIKLTAEDLNFLLKVNHELLKKNVATGSAEPIEITPAGPSHHILRFNWVAGSLTLPSGTKIEIYPHLGNRTPTALKERTSIFIEMFLKVYGVHERLKTVLENFPSTEADLPGIKSLLAHIYIRLLSETLKKEGQLPREYIPEEKIEARIRGKILFKRNIPLERKIPRLYQRIHTRSPVIELNLMLHQALNLAQQESELETHTRQISSSLENNYFGFIDFPRQFRGRTNFVIAQIKSNRLYRNFLLPAIVARMLIENTISNPYSYRKQGTAFLISTPELFEKYITLSLEEFFSEKIKSGEIVFQSQSSRFEGTKHHLIEIRRDGQRTPLYSMIPDNIVRNNRTGETVIIDTKYKIFGSAETDASGEDLYQMYAYARAFKASKVILVYPSIEEFFTQEATFFDNSAQLSFVKIPLGKIEPEEVKTWMPKLFKDL